MSNWFVFVVLLCYLHTSLCQVKFCEKNCQINEVFSSKVCVQHNTCYEESFNHSSICLIGPGCVCRQGFIRHQDTFQCVPITSCVDKIKPKQCAVNEFFSDCDAACQKTCTNNLNTARCRCVSGCVCRTGYIRSDVNYRCIPENSCRSKFWLQIVGNFHSKMFFQGCPLGFSYNLSTKSCVFKCQECRENETYKNCASCEPTCSNVTENHIVCTQNCLEGCFCQKGFKRSPTTDLCVPEKNCRRN